ncbi:MAG: PAS domain S-box protein [Chloroflexota bacterium]
MRTTEAAHGSAGPARAEEPGETVACVVTGSRERIFRALHDVAVATGGVVDLYRLAGLVTQSARELMAVDGCSIQLWNEERRTLELLANDGAAVSSIGAIRPGQGAAGIAFQRMRPVCVVDYRSWKHALPGARARPTVSIACVPLVANGRPIGTLSARAHYRREFTADELDLLTLLAAQVAPSVHTATLYQEAERRSRELRAIVEQMPSGVAVHDRDGHVTLANAAALRIWGLEELPTEATPIASLARHDLSGRELSADELPFARALRGEAVQGLEYTIAPAGGESPRRVLATARPLDLDDGGGVRAAVVVFSDVTRERELVRQVEESERRFRAIYDVMACCVILFDAELHMVYANPMAKKLLHLRPGIRPGTLMMPPGWQMLGGDGEPMEDASRPVVRLLATGRPQVGARIAFQPPDGRRVWLEGSTVPLPKWAGQGSVVASYVDVTARREAEETARSTAARFRTLIEHVSDVTVVVGANDELTYVSPASVATLGYQPEELLGKQAFDLIHRGDRARQFGGLRALLASPPATSGTDGAGSHRSCWVGEFRLRHRDGSWRWFEAVADDLRAENAVGGVVITLRDTTAGKAAEDSLRLLQSAVQHVAEGVVIGTTGSDGTCAQVVYANPAYCRMAGYQAEELIGKPASQLQGSGIISTGDPRGGWDASGADAHGEAVARRKDGSEFFLEWDAAPIRDLRGDITHWVSIQRDVTERHQAEAALAYQALHDCLTGLPNRALLLDRLDQAIRDAQRERRMAALLLLDLDHFKEVNDVFGHHVGDELLRQVASRLGGTLRQSDTVARLGGDEFAMLLPHVAQGRQAVVAANKVIRAIRQPFQVEGHQIEAGGSIGVACFPRDGRDGSTLLRHADVAMYTAKRGGGGCRRYSPDQDRH